MKILDSSESIDKFIKENTAAMLYFSSECCNVCSSLLPKIEETLKKYSNIVSAKIDVDKVQSAAGEYMIFALPAIIVFIDGKEVIREARFISIMDLEEKINRVYFATGKKS